MKTEIEYHKNFLKNYRKRVLHNSKLDRKFRKRLDIFIKNPNNSLLQDHRLVGEMKQYRAFSVTGDIRVVYMKLDNLILLYDIGTHPQIYGM